jgi:Guanine nucleotide exchange factor synembryn
MYDALIDELLAGESSKGNCTLHVMLASVAVICSVNPVTGRYEEQKSSPLEGMSMEQKEYEAMQLVSKLDKLQRLVNAKNELSFILQTFVSLHVRVTSIVR